ncbi:MAG: amidohydrolase family protein [Planctomycetota bacterium]
MNHSSQILIRCLGVCDGTLSVAGDTRHPAAMLVEQEKAGLHVLACGSAESIESHPASASIAQTIDCTDAVVMPGIINAHTHLDLTVIGPLPHEPSDGFVNWVHRIREGRPSEPEAITASVEQGVAMSRAGGVVAVGDIAGNVGGAASLASATALRRTGMAGVSYIEFFAIGTTERERVAAAIDLVREHHHTFTGRHRIGLQPHATNTVSASAYRRAIEAAKDLGLPVMTHLAESPEEREFVAHASGPQRELLEGLGLWTPSLDDEFGNGASPVEQLAPVLAGSRTAAVHVNQCTDADLERLVAAQLPVVYCPRASAYFGAEQHFGPHRYRDMLDAGLTVAIGTDSIVNLPAGTDRISPLDDIRLLSSRDGTDAGTLIRMITSNAASVLGIDPGAVSIAPGSRPIGVVAVAVAEHEIRNPAASIVRSESAPRLLFEVSADVLPE